MSYDQDPSRHSTFSPLDVTSTLPTSNEDVRKDREFKELRNYRIPETRVLRNDYYYLTQECEYPTNNYFY